MSVATGAPRTRNTQTWCSRGPAVSTSPPPCRSAASSKASWYWAPLPRLTSLISSRCLEEDSL